MGNVERMLKNTNTLSLGVRDIITTGTFDPFTFENDIALMFLNQSIPESYKSAEVMNINLEKDVPVDTLCNVTGWGRTEKVFVFYTKQFKYCNI